MSNFKDKKILVILTGSIACFKAASLISQLVQRGAVVQTVTTKSALKFLGEATLEGLTGRRNLSDTFEAGSMMDHIHFARWAEMVLVYPCSANFLAQWSLGLAPDLASTLLLAKQENVPTWVAPAMNPVMWKNKVTQNHLQTLVESGVRLLSPENGVLACGEVGEGRLAEPDHVLNTLEACFIKKGKVLITYGGTVEPVDSVRSLTNFSTGNTGRTLAEQLVQKGWEVTSLRASTAPKADGATDIEFTDFKSLDEGLQKILKEQKFVGVIHLAAVSDYSVEKVVGEDGFPIQNDGKISGEMDLTIHLMKNFKILNRIKSYGGSKPPAVIGFKLTVNATSQQIQSAVNKVFAEGHVDLVVHNDFSKIHQGHVFSLFDNSGRMVASGQGKTQMAQDLDMFLTSGYFRTNKESEVTL